MTDPDKPSGTNGRPSTWQVISKGVAIGLMVLLSVVSYLLLEKLDKIEVLADAVASMDKRLTLMEAADLAAVTIEATSSIRETIYGLKLDNQAAHALIRATLASLRAELPKQYPPPETRLRIEVIEKRIDHLDDLIEAIPGSE